MANSYSDPNFSFDTTTTTFVADATALKGSAPAATDLLYVFEAPTVTIESSCNLKKVYLGDNPGGDATVKTGHLIVSAGATLTIHQSTDHRGLSGVGSTSTFLLNGASDANRAIVTANTNRYGVPFYESAIKITSTWGQFNNLYSIYGRAAHDMQNTIFSNFDRTLYYGDGTNCVMPTSLNGCTFTGGGLAIFDGTVNNVMDWLTFFKTNEIKCIGSATGGSAINIRFGNATSTLTRFISLRTNAASMQAVPSWTTTTGIQSLADSTNLTLSASWNAVTHGTGDTVRYRIYIRDGSAPDTFGIASAYYLGETVDLSFIIGCDAAGAALVDTHDYYVIVRAATALSNEDTNTTTLNAVVTGGGAPGTIDDVLKLQKATLGIILSK